MEVGIALRLIMLRRLREIPTKDAHIKNIVGQGSIHSMLRLGENWKWISFTYFSHLFISAIDNTTCVYFGKIL